MNISPDWINEHLPKFELLGKHVAFIIENLFQSNAIEYLSVSYRTKSKSSIQEKITRKNYSSPLEQMTDISGVRVILFFESDIEKACDIIKSIFNVDIANSTNNAERLSIDKIGYRSVHYVCDIGNDRRELAEYSYISGLKCEIQIRTMLQHAWAELTHDRNYKFEGHLPLDIKRKINLYSGMLELVDNGFAEIISEIDSYQEALRRQPVDAFLEQPVSSVSLKEFFEKVCIEYDIPAIQLHRLKKSSMSELLDEIDFMGIKNLKELKELIPKNYAEVLKEFNQRATIYGFVRDLLLIMDYEKLRAKPGLDWCVLQLDEDGEHDIGLEYYSKLMSPVDAHAIYDLYNRIQ